MSLPQEQYDLAVSSVPIVCADLVPLGTGTPHEIGLIFRDTYEGSTAGWCLVGGRVWRDEPLTEAVKRHVRTTLGEEFSFDLGSLKFHGYIEYFTKSHLGEFHDPRKHAVALTYSAVCQGPPEPQEEALDFRWFQRDELAALPFGFGQGKVLERVLRCLDGTSEWAQ